MDIQNAGYSVAQSVGLSSDELNGDDYFLLGMFACRVFET